MLTVAATVADPRRRSGRRARAGRQTQVDGAEPRVALEPLGQRRDVERVETHRGAEVHRAELAALDQPLDGARVDVKEALPPRPSSGVAARPRVGGSSLSSSASGIGRRAIRRRELGLVRPLGALAPLLGSSATATDSNSGSES